MRGRKENGAACERQVSELMDYEKLGMQSELLSCSCWDETGRKERTCSDRSLDQDATWHCDIRSRNLRSRR